VVAGTVDEPGGAVDEQRFRGPRGRLVEELQDGGIRDLAVLRAFERTPRHLFVPASMLHRAYEDSALPIGNGQTISQPSVHARYLSELRLVERVRELLDRARDVIRRVGASNISLLLGDGTYGWREYAPYDAILVSAAAPQIPQPLFDQLREGGRILIPLGERDEQMLTVATRVGDTVQRRDIAPVRFVPLVGKFGWTG
jgi:protein-L-isoaspartate(D-aspartate) O-methyltransferase